MATAPNSPLFFEMTDFCLEPPHADLLIIKGPSEPACIDYHRYLIERHLRYRLLQIYFVCSTRLDAFNIPVGARLGLHFGCYWDSRPRYLLMNCVASDLHCSTPDRAEDALMETLADVMDYFFVNSQLPIQTLAAVQYEVPMNTNVGPADSKRVVAFPRPH